MSWNTLLKLSLSDDHNSKRLAEYIGEINHTRSALGSTPLQFAVISENMQTFHLILKYTENINATNDYNETALHWACKVGNATFIKLLIHSGADINSLDSEYNTPLHWAAESSHLNIVALLKEYGALTHLRNADKLTYQNLLPTESKYFLSKSPSFLKRILHRSG